MLISGLVAILIFQISSIIISKEHFNLGVVLLIPAAIDGITQNMNIRKSNNKLRLVTGLLLGLGLVIIAFSISNLLNS